MICNVYAIQRRGSMSARPKVANCKSYDHVVDFHVLKVAGTRVLSSCMWLVVVLEPLEQRLFLTCKHGAHVCLEDTTATHIIVR